MFSIGTRHRGNGSVVRDYDSSLAPAFKCCWADGPRLCIPAVPDSFPLPKNLHMDYKAERVFYMIQSESMIQSL